MIVGVLHATAVAMGYVEVQVPSGHLATKANHIYIVGRSDAPLVEITLNGQVEQAVVPKDSVFHARLTFGYGLNEITVTPFYGDQTDTHGDSDTLEILSGPNVDEKYERLFEPYSFHEGKSPDGCLNCHRVDAATPDLINSSESCYDCHRDIKQRFKTHIPENDRACINCHWIKADLTEAPRGTFADANPCYQCHPDKISEFTQDYIHGPVAGGSCGICHDPHGSVYEKSLLTSVPALCPTCHDMRAEQDMRISHPPFGKGQCGACHDAHSTNHKWMLVKKSQEVCMSCHMEMGSMETHQHPYNKKPRHQLASPLTLTTSGQLECLSCHQPHASNMEHLLRTSDEENACSGCHPDR